MRGRKPKENAIRRGGAGALSVEATPVTAIVKPPHVAANPTMSACWDTLIDGAVGLRESDTPLLESYCYWYAVLRQATSQTITPDGKVITMVGTRNADGHPDPSSVRMNPDIRTAEKATQMLQRLGDALNATPTARMRAGLVDAMTRSTQADVVRKTLDGYEEFKRMRAANA